MNNNLNYFSSLEQDSVISIKNKRNIFILPVVRFFSRIGLTANMVSFFGFFVLLFFIYFFNQQPLLSVIFLWLHVLIDNFDGPLARLQGKDGDAGALVDIICDHSGMAVVIATTMFYGLINNVLGITYVYIYTVLVIFTIVLNKAGQKTKLVFRSKYLFYGILTVWSLWSINLLNYALLLFTILMLPGFFLNFTFLYKYFLSEK